MTTHAHALGAPVTDLEDYVEAATRPACRPVSDPVPRPEPARDPRRNRLRSAGLVTAVALLAAGMWVVLRSPAAAPDRAASLTPPAGIEGFAELYVATYLTSAGPQTADALDPFVVAAVDVDAMTPYERYVPRAATLGVRTIGPGYWAVTVAAEVLYRIDGGYGPGSLEVYDVAIAGNTGALVATAAPLPVPTPTATAPFGTYAELRLAGDEAAAALAREFLDGYLAGSGLLPRLVTPDSDITPIVPAPAVSVEVADVRVGVIGEDTWITAAVLARDDAERTLTTAITLRIVDTGGGPLVAAVLPGPPPVPTP